MKPEREPKVAYVVSRFPAPTETFVLNEIVSLSARGLDVRVYPLFGAAKGPRHTGTEEVMQRVTYVPWFALFAAQLTFVFRQPRIFVKTWAVVLWGHRRKMSALVRALYTLPRAVWLARELQRNGVTHLHAHWATWPTLAAFVVERLTGLPYSFTAHAHDLYLDRFLLKEKVERSRFVVTISEFNRRLIGEVCGEAALAKTQVIHCGVDPDVFQPRERPERPSGTPLLLCVAGLRDYKGQIHLIDACHQLRQWGEAFVCVLVGDGPEKDRLARRIGKLGLEEVVKLVGALPQAQVREFVKAADVVVLPSVVTPKGMMDGIPVALMEAMAAGCAVVSTRVSGIPELVEDGVSGMIVPPADPKALAQSIRLLLADPSLRERLGRGARAAVLAEYTLSENTGRLHSIFGKKASTSGSVFARNRPGKASDERVLPPSA